MNKLFTKIVGVALGLTMAIGVGVAVGSNAKEASPVHAAAGDSPIILDGTNLSLSSTATTADTEKTYGGVTYVVSTGAKTQSSTGTNKFSATAILIGKSGTYIYNKTAIPGEITKFEVYANKGASAKVSVGVNFSATAAITSWSSTSATWTQTLSTLDSVYDASSKIVSGAKYFRYQVTNANNSQVEFRITYTAQKYTVTYNANNATSGTVPTDSTQYTNGSTVTVKGNTGSLARTGYTFGGWNTRADGTGTNYAAGSGTFSISGNTTLYAKWTVEKYSVSASITNGGFTGATGDNAATYGTAYNATITANSGHSLPTELTVTMGGSATSAYTYNSGTGAFSIASPTGNIAISATCPSSGATEYIFDYDLTHCSITSAPESMWSDDMVELVIVPDNHYKLPAADANKVSVTGAADWYYDEDDGTITIDGAEDDLTVAVECVAKAVNSISVTATNVTADGGNPTTVEEGATVTLEFDANDGYALPDSVTVLGAASNTWTQNSGQLQITGGTSNISVTVTGVAKTLSSITLGSTSGTHTLGTNFTLPTVTATFNTGNEVVTGSAEYTCLTDSGMEDAMFIKTGTVTIQVSYTFGGNTATANYTATVNKKETSDAKFVKVTSGTVTSGKYLIVNETAGVAFNGGIDSSTYDATNNVVDVTISSSEIAYSAAMDAASFTFDATAGTLKSAAGYYVGRTSNSTGINASTSTAYTNTMSVSSGTATIQASNNYVLRYNSSSGQNRFRYYSGTSVDDIQIYKYQAGVTKTLIRLAATGPADYVKVEGYTCVAADFSATAYFDNDTSKSVTPTIVSGATLSAGSNTVRLSYTEDNVTVYRDVTVVADEYTAQLDGIIWSLEDEIQYVFDGDKISFGTLQKHYDDDNTQILSPSECTVALYTSKSTSNKDHDVSNVSTYEWDIDNDNGLYLGVTFSGYTKFTGVVNVVETINSVYPTEEASLNETFTASSVGWTNGQEVSSYNGTAFSLAFTDGTSNATKYYSSGNGTLRAYVGATITVSSSYDITALKFTFETAGTLSADVGTWSSPDWSGKAKSITFTVDANTRIEQIKVTYDGQVIGDDIANTNAAVQKAVLEFAVHFNDTMQCVNGGTTVNVASKWSSLSSDFSTALSGFTGDDLAHFKALFANASSVEDGDTLQDMLARYDYIVAKYKLDNDFLHTAADRAEVAQSPHVSPFINVFGENTNTVAIIIIISMVSVTVIGGYFFLRKRKENI